MIAGNSKALLCGDTCNASCSGSAGWSNPVQSAGHARERLLQHRPQRQAPGASCPCNQFSFGRPQVQDHQRIVCGLSEQLVELQCAAHTASVPFRRSQGETQSRAPPHAADQPAPAADITDASTSAAQPAADDASAGGRKARRRRDAQQRAADVQASAAVPTSAADVLRVFRGLVARLSRYTTHSV